MPKVGKTIRVNFFANQQLKPKRMTWNGEIVDFYPLYASVHYGSPTNTIKVEKSGVQVLVTPDLEQLKQPELKAFTDDFSKKIINVVTKESEQLGEKYSVIGLSARLKKYSQSIPEILKTVTLGRFTESLKPGLRMMLDDNEPSPEENLLNDAINLIRDRDAGNVTVFNWMFDNGREIIKNILLDKKSIKVERYGIQEYRVLQVNKICDLIDELI